MHEPDLRGQLERCHADAYGWALSCCRYQHEDAEELLQTVYLLVLEGRARFDGRSDFQTWLFAVIRRVAANQRRSSWLHRLLLEREAEQLRPAAPRPADADSEAHERVGRLRAALATLATRQREVLELVFYQNLTVEKAAAVMGVSLGAARTHYARGKARLGGLLAGWDDR